MEAFFQPEEKYCAYTKNKWLPHPLYLVYITLLLIEGNFPNTDKKCIKKEGKSVAPTWLLPVDIAGE